MTAAIVERLAGWAVPAPAVRLPERTAEAVILDWFRELRLDIPPPAPMALRWLPGGGCVEIPVDQAVEDEDLVLSSSDLADYQPDIEDLAAGCVAAVHEAEQRYPGPLSWRRWKLTRRAASFLYASGITRSGGSWGMDGADPIGGTIYTLPSLRDVMPRRHATMRPYLLWKPSWWWECHARQGLRIRGRHRPEPPFALGICGACCPCPYCGAHQECRDDCELYAS